MKRRRKQEFKPDRPRSTWLSRMTPTKLQRKAMLKWSMHGLVLLLLSVIQDVFCARLRLWGATTNLVPCGIFMVCLLEGAESGGVFSLVGSVFYLLSGSAPGIYSIVLITGIAVFVTLFRQAFLQKGFITAMLCMAVSMVLYEMATLLVGKILSYTDLNRVSYFLFSAALSMIAAPILYPIGTAIRSIGGETWKD